MQIKESLCPNYTNGRNGRKIMAIVNHITAGSFPGCLNWMMNSAAKASAHYLVTKAGEIFRLVADNNTAWHAGIVNKPTWKLYDGTNPNLYTIGIEHEALSGEGLTEAQYSATLELHRYLINTYGLSIDRQHIIGHNEIDCINRANDPGVSFPWERLMNDLVFNTASVLIRVKQTSILGLIINNISYAPVRELTEKLGRTVLWDAQHQAALIPPVCVETIPPDENGKVTIFTGRSMVQGELVNGKSYAPVRKLAELLGHKVSWDNENRTVIIE